MLMMSPKDAQKDRIPVGIGTAMMVKNFGSENIVLFANGVIKIENESTVMLM